MRRCNKSTERQSMNSGDEGAIQSGYVIGVVPYRTRFWQPRLAVKQEAGRVLAYLGGRGQFVGVHGIFVAGRQDQPRGHWQQPAQGVQVLRGGEEGRPGNEPRLND